MAVFTNGGLTLLASALQNNGTSSAISYVSVGLGAGTLSVALVNGNPYTSLTLAVNLAVSVANGQSLTIIDSLGDTQVVTANPGEIIGASTIRVNSFNANHAYAIGSGVVNTPAITDTALQNETYRLVAIPGIAGANPGESLNGSYFDPTAPTAQYLEVGYWGGAAATATLGTGTLVARDIQFWNHVNGLDSASFQLDSTL